VILGKGKLQKATVRESLIKRKAAFDI